MINPSDIQEQKFLNQLAIDNHSAQATTIFIAPPAETIGQYKGATSKDRFITDLQNAVHGGCKPSGCGPWRLLSGRKMQIRRKLNEVEYFSFSRACAAQK